MYLDTAQTDCVYKVLSIVLNIGNVKFTKGVEQKSN